MQLNFTTPTCTSQLMEQHGCHTLSLVMMLYWYLTLTWYIPHILHFVMGNPSAITPITSPHFTHYGRTLNSFSRSLSCYFILSPLRIWSHHLSSSLFTLVHPPLCIIPSMLVHSPPILLSLLSYLPCSNGSWKFLSSRSWKLFSQT
jgi:hypothetical protein